MVFPGLIGTEPSTLYKEVYFFKKDRNAVFFKANKIGVIEIEGVIYLKELGLKNLVISWKASGVIIQ